MAEVIRLADAPPLDRSTIVQAVYDYLGANLPGGYTPFSGELDDLIINGTAQQLSEVVALFSEVMTGVFRYYGLKVAKVDPIEAVPATLTATWAAGDTVGHTIPAGTEASVDGVGFETVADAVIAPGATTVTGVQMAASLPGVFANGLSGPALSRDNFTWNATVTVTASSAGGQDAESDDDYLGRLVEELRLLSRAAIIAEDFARLTGRVANVGRVLVLDLYNATTSTPNVGGHVTIVPTDEAGEATSAPTKTAISALFDTRSVFPIVVHVIDPTYHDIDVVVTASYWPGFEAATVEAQVDEQIRAFLNPLTWGMPQGGEPEGDWFNDTTISRYALAGAIERADGVRRVESLTIEGVGADYALTGVAPLPRVGADPAITLVAA